MFVLQVANGEFFTGLSDQEFSTWNFAKALRFHNLDKVVAVSMGWKDSVILQIDEYSRIIGILDTSKIER